mgnify:FL=1
MAWILDLEEKGVGGLKIVDKTVSHFFHGGLILSPPYSIYICNATYILRLTNDDLQGKG